MLTQIWFFLFHIQYTADTMLVHEQVHYWFGNSGASRNI